MNIFELEAESRSDMGKGASRRLRRDGKVPAIMYGAEVDPQSITLVHSEIIKRLAHEGFYSHILTVNVDGKSTKAVLRDMQRRLERMLESMPVAEGAGVTLDEEQTVLAPVKK